MLRQPKKWVLSDESVNSYDFITRTSGIRLEDFNANPVMLFNHDFNKVIGNWQDIKVENGKLTATDNFHMEDEEAKLISDKVDKGFIKGCSIGFKILKCAKEKVAGKEIMVITDCVLKEVSITALPANKNAVRMYDENDKLLSETELLAYLSSKSTTKIPNLKTKAMKTLRDKLIALFATFSLNITLSDAEDEDTMASEVTAGIKKAIELKDGEIATLKTKLNEFETQRVDSLIAQALADKKFTKADEQKWRDRALKDFEMTQDTLAAIPAVKNINAELKGTAAAEQADGKKVEDRKNWTLYDWSKNDEAGLKLMQKNNPDEFAKLLDDEEKEAAILARQK